MKPEEACRPPRTWLGRLWLKFRIKYLDVDDGETLTCRYCGEKLYID